MKSLCRFGFAALALVVFGCAGGGRHEDGRIKVTPVQGLEFTDHVYYHNMGTPGTASTTTPSAAATPNTRT